MPLPDFIAHLYRKRYGKDLPDTVRSIEEIAAAKRAKKQAKKASKIYAAPDPDTAHSAAGTPVDVSNRILILQKKRARDGVAEDGNFPR